MARHLTPEELNKLATRKGAKEIAVKNFLSSCPIDDSPPYGAKGNAGSNLSSDARAYKWNAATQKAIRDGLKLMFR